LVQAFLVCREIYESPRDVVLVGPSSGVTAPAYPVSSRFSVYAHLTDAHGRYQLSLRLVDGDDQVTWEWTVPGLIEEGDPLAPHRVVLHDLVLDFPHPGRYDLVMAANGEDLAHHALWARLPSGEPA
jgi:hypothetical protein